MEVPMGRGRGRSRNPEGKGIPLRRPASLKEDSALSQALEKLQLDSTNPADVVQLVKTTSETEEQLRKNVLSLHEFAKSSKDKALLAGSVCGMLSQFEVKDVKFRNLLLENAQRDFIEREGMKDASITRFHCAIVFLCEIFKEMKLQDGSPIKILAKPVLEYMLMLLKSSSEADFNLFCELFPVIGKMASKFDNQLFQEVLFQCRKKLISFDELGTSQKSKILRIFELALSDFSPLSPKVEEFYRDYA